MGQETDSDSEVRCLQLSQHDCGSSRLVLSE